MPITAGGTAYTTRASTATGYGTTAMTVADAHFGSAAIPTLMYCHGAGGPYNQFATLSAWQGLRDWLIDNGCAIVEGAGGLDNTAGGQNWGNDTARLAYLAYDAYWATVISVGARAVVGRSMGKLIAAWLFARSALAASYLGLISNSGVSTINTGGAASSANYFSLGLWPAYGASDAASAVAASLDHDPMNWSPSLWDGKKILTLWGDADTTVPVATRGAGPLRTLFAGRPALDRTDIRIGGTHLADNGSYLQVAAMTAFLAEIGFVVPPAPAAATFGRVLGRYRYLDGERYAITRG